MEEEQAFTTIKLIENKVEEENKILAYNKIYQNNFIRYQAPKKTIDEESKSTVLIIPQNSVYCLEIVKNPRISKKNDKQLIFSDSLLKISIQYTHENYSNPFSWEIEKSYQEIKNVYILINFERQKKKIIFDDDTLESLDKILKLKTNEELHMATEMLIETLNVLINHDSLKNEIFVKEFFEISLYSFDDFDETQTLSLFTKPKEGYILKKCFHKDCISVFLCSCWGCRSCKVYQKRWFVLKEDMIFYLESSTSKIGKDIFWFDQHISLQKDYKGIPHSLAIFNLSRKLTLKFENNSVRETWYKSILKKKEEYKLSLNNPYKSFANEKYNCDAKWFVDGHDYFTHLYDSLMKSKESIFIAGWWLSPELFLIRPVKFDDEKKNNLIEILKKKAEDGVQIKILIYKEFKLALSMNSIHTKNVFNNLHKNIKVTRHPKKNLDLLWSHHEKIVIIDQKVAYLGGLDLCWGRYDDSNHVICEPENENQTYVFPGIDYSNARMRDFENVKNYKKLGIGRDSPRLPWHDVHCFLEGSCVSDLSRHFIERWNFSRTVRFNPKSHAIISVKKNQKEGTMRSIQASENSTLPTKKKINRFSTFYQGFKIQFKKITERMRKSKEYFIDETDEDQTLVGMNVTSEKPSESKKICQILRSASEWSAGLVKKTESSIQNAYYDLIENSQHYIYIENQFFVSKSFEDDELDSNEDYEVKNKIALCLRRRIEKAYKNNEKFRVFIFLPLLPGFEGDISDSHTLQIIVKYTYKSISRNKGFSLVEKLIEIMGDNYKNYITFLSLRTHGEINGIPSTEMIYIHSKLMIIDDLVVLIGSANINDRSLKGNRDSEIAATIKDKKEVASKMNGQPFSASSFAFSLRVQLMKEHFGFLKAHNDEVPLDDPLSDVLWEFIKVRANKNTMMYREIFNCYPDDKFNLLSDIEKEKPKGSKEITVHIKNMIEKYSKLKSEISGNVVEFPLYFLKNENLNKGFLYKENLVPIKNFL